MNFSSPILGRIAPKGREPNLPGDRYALLTLQSEVLGVGRTAWLCLCECGTEKAVLQVNLRGGKSESCGCRGARRDALLPNFSSLVPGRLAPMGGAGNLPGDKYGRLVLVGEIPNQDVEPSKRRWDCLCDCGTRTTAVIGNIRRGNTESCGCLHREIASGCNTSHGMTGTRTYGIWKDVVTRTTNPKYKNWADYGGRGIGLDPAWLIFENFLSDMGEAPEGLSIDRIDNAKGYSPSNCRWATRTQQNRNQRSNRLVSYLGRNICTAEAAEIAGLNVGTIRTRLHRGWSIQRALGPDFSDPI